LKIILYVNKMEIQDYSDYLVYEDGRVYNKKYNRFLKIQKHNAGYYYVTLSKNNEKKAFLIHRLVGLHYLPLVEGKNYIDHIDGDKLNNNLNNLRWVTNIENSNNYQKIHKDNTLGFKNISPYRNGFIFEKTIYGKRYRKYHKNLNELHWYKFVFLMIKKNIINNKC